MHTFGDLLNHPAAIIFLAVVIALFMLKFQGLTYPDFIDTTNSINPQTFALVVLVVGFWMLLDCKTYGIDTTVAGGVIGCGINMLTGQKQTAKPDFPPGAVVSQQTKVDVPATDPNVLAPKP